MESRPEIAALQSDPGLEMRAREGLATALASWREGAGQKVLADFAAYADGKPLADLPALGALFGDDDAGAACALVEPLISALLAAWAEHPLGLVPLRHSCGEVTSSLLLAQQGASLLTLSAIDGAGLAASPPPQSVSFAPAEEWEVVLAGQARARIVQRVGEKLVADELDLAPGIALGREAEREALVFDRVDGALVMLRLQRRRDTAQPRRAYSLANGALVRQATATPAESRHEVAVSLLGAMGRKDAAPLLAEIARDEALGDSLRWQALRQCLGLDTSTGFWTLTAISRAGADPLAIPAGALRAQLLESYPQLSEIDPCPA